MISVPYGPVKTAIFPPEPMRALTLPRNDCTVMLAASARLRAVSTIFSCSAKSRSGVSHTPAVKMPAEATKRLREKFSAIVDYHFFYKAATATQPSLPYESFLLRGRRRKRPRSPHGLAQLSSRLPAFSRPYPDQA